MAKTIMISSYKGGVGKTQTSLEMSYALAAKGFRVLGLDYDHQANYTRVLSNNNSAGSPERQSAIDDPSVKVTPAKASIYFQSAT